MCVVEMQNINFQLFYDENTQFLLILFNKFKKKNGYRDCKLFFKFVFVEKTDSGRAFWKSIFLVELSLGESRLKLEFCSNICIITQ